MLHTILIVLAIYALLVAACLVLDHKTGFRYPRLFVIIPLLIVDCIVNAILLQSWRKTLSGEAWHQREHEYWGWCHRWINKAFFWQSNHCKTQAKREAQWGSVWVVWWRDLRGLPL